MQKKKKKKKKGLAIGKLKHRPKIQLDLSQMACFASEITTL